MRNVDAIRLFGLNNLSIEADLRQIEEQFEVDLGHRDRNQDETDRAYYPQFSQRLRSEAASMGRHYSIFYCLENFVRELIVERLEEEHGPQWWDHVVPDGVQKNAQQNKKREAASAVTPRSEHLIDYTTFGELGDIIQQNWGVFGDMFRDLSAVRRVLSNLNTLRASIAHCNALADDEVMRLHLSLRDWFRQME